MQSSEAGPGPDAATPDAVSPWVAGLRSVALVSPDVAAAVRFYTQVWHLDTVAHDAAGGVYLRASGDAHHVLSLHPGARAALRDVTLAARSAEALRAVAGRAAALGAGNGRPAAVPAAVAGGGSGAGTGAAAPLDEPGGGHGVTLADADGRVLRLVHGDARHPDARSVADRPLRLAHAVLNSHDVGATQRWFEDVLGFRLADRTRIMAFLNCNADHHSIALGDADNDALNHIAFLMPDVESVMRGGGRMRDAGHAIEWGPGRHGPGDNVFNYFVGPDDVVVEYTAEIEQVGRDHVARGPADWAWPPGRVDQWGISAPPSARLKAAQRAIHFLQA